MKQYKYKLPDKCRIGDVTIRTTYGTDEDEAVIAAEGTGADPKMELVSLSIVAVDGKPCLPGDSGIEGWPSKTRAVVRQFFDRINDFPKAKLLPLIEEAEDTGGDIVEGRSRTRYPFPEGCDLKFVVLQEMMEADERAAAAAGSNTTEEMIRRCVVSTDRGDELTMKALKALDTKTRNILSVYWAGMNFVPEEELAPLAKAAEEAPEAASVESSDGPSSQSGYGSPAQADAG